VATKNKKVVPENMTNFNDYSIKYDFSSMTMALDHLDRFYYNLDRMIQENPEKNLEEIMEEIDRTMNKQASSAEENENETLRKPNISLNHIDGGEGAVDEEIDKLFNKKDSEYQKFSFLRVVGLIFEALLTYWEYICYMILIMYHLTTNGWITLVIPCAIFGYALTEETRPKFKIWSLLFYFFVVVILLKFMREYLTIQEIIDSSVV